MLRAIAAVVFFGAMFVVVPEGLAAAWASELSHHGGDRGFDQAFIMTASPVGAVIGAIVVGRLVSPATRQRLLRPLAVLVPTALVPVFLTHSVVGHRVRSSLISSFAVAGLTAPANGLFVQALPAEFRARAFGVMQFGPGALPGRRPSRRRLHRLARRGVDRGDDLQLDRRLRHDRDQRRSGRRPSGSTKRSRRCGRTTP